MTHGLQAATAGVATNVLVGSFAAAGAIAGSAPGFDLAGQGVLRHGAIAVEGLGLAEALGGLARLAQIIQQHRPSVNAARGARGSSPWPSRSWRSDDTAAAG